MTRDWQIIETDTHSFDAGSGAKAAIGFISLSVDQASQTDSQNWLAPFSECALYASRVPMSPVVTPQTLADMLPHLSDSAALLVPPNPLDAIIFSCTSGTVAIGEERVSAAIKSQRPDVPVVTPIRAAKRGFSAMGISKISLLAPYQTAAAELIAGSFEEGGLALQRCATFALTGDQQMNRLSAQTLIDAAVAQCHPDSEGLFISCTGLRTAGIVSALEARLGIPVITSNQAAIWEALCLAEHPELALGEGRLFGYRSAGGN